MDSHLTYDFHTTKLILLCMSTLCQINRVKDSFDSDILSLLIEALVISKLLYCSSVWSNTSSVNLKKLHAVQNFACRIITNTKEYDHITSVLQKLGWLPIEQLLLFKGTIVAYKCINNLAPNYLCNKFRKRSQLHDHPICYQDLLSTPFYRTAAGQRTFQYRGAKLRGNLGSKLKNIPTISSFKKKSKFLETFYLSSCLS